LNSVSNNYSRVEIKVKTVEISRKPCKASQLASRGEAITFDIVIEFSISLVFWKLDIQSFPRTPRSAQSEFEKAFKYAIEVRTEKLEEKNMIADVSKPDPAATKGLLA